MKNIVKLFLFLVVVGAVTIASIEIINGSTVTVSANVTQTVSCNSATSTTVFGTLAVGSISTSAPNVTTTISCNSGAGCSLTVNDAGNTSNPGLYNSSATKLIQSADATLSAGTEGYGIQAVTNANGTGATLTIATKYDKSSNDVGGLTIAPTTIASSAAPASNREVVVAHKAAISGLTDAGNYTDTITYGCSAN